jgi:large subunit ribosomal protein L5
MLQERFKKEIMPQLMQKLGIKNPMLAPKLEKIVVSSCTGDAVQNPKVLETMAVEVAAITGQKPVVTRAKKSIAAFKLREGLPIGVSVTLRRERMYEFFNRLVSISLPRTRDFKGLPKKSFDGNGNYTFGIQEQIIFSEISSEKIEKPRGMNITIVTSAKDDNMAKELLVAMGLPLRA